MIRWAQARKVRTISGWTNRLWSERAWIRTVKPEEVLLDNELREVMEEAITRVPPALRIVFIWRDLEGMSTAETAEILGISEGTVKVRLHRARLHLRQALAAYFLERRSGGEGPSNQERSQKELSKEETT